MRVLGRLGTNDLLKRAGTAADTCTKKIAYAVELTDDGTGLRNSNSMVYPTAFGQCSRERRKSGHTQVLRNMETLLWTTRMMPQAAPLSTKIICPWRIATNLKSNHEAHWIG